MASRVVVDASRSPSGFDGVAGKTADARDVTGLYVEPPDLRRGRRVNMFVLCFVFAPPRFADARNSNSYVIRFLAF